MVISLYIVVLFFSFSYPQSEIDIDHLQLLDHDSIYLNLESRGTTVFLIDQNYPNVTSDINYLNFKIDGSMMYPLYNSIPKEVFLSSSDTTTMSQISFLQDHSEYFYDTSIALKSYLRPNVNLLTQIESKSRKGMAMMRLIVAVLAKELIMIKKHYFQFIKIIQTLL